MSVAIESLFLVAAGAPGTGTYGADPVRLMGLVRRIEWELKQWAGDVTIRRAGRTFQVRPNGHYSRLNVVENGCILELGVPVAGVVLFLKDL